ncbi:MAG: hypothetical protein JO157_00560 [Acetobacteraceae bacterium]|nr:hypothetical protein [Acetobacteraceae bacterium]
MLALAAPAAAALDIPRPSPRVEVTQFSYHERVIIRVPRMSQPAPLAGAVAVPVQPVKWREKKGPKCIAADSMAGAMITTARQVDLVLRGGKRVRARLDSDCKPLDFYSGFYLRPASDGKICADRDSIRVRSGASCDIDEFRTLVAAR